MQAAELRKSFIQFFQNKNHTFVAGNSTIPVGDQTILFTIAGMTQFKAALTGQEIRSYKRAVNAQKCIRIGDLDDVGKDGRHLTMFEMLGSWSFGDYYKKEAIEWAWEFVTKIIKFDTNRLWVSVHHSDQEAFELWKKTGMPDDRIVKLGDKDNFWAMGPTGPCGPCTELYYDQGPEVGNCAKQGNTQCQPGCDCDRYLEFWNLVFMQYDRQEDGTLKELPFKSVDTGAGLERFTALTQSKTTAYEIDSFRRIKEAIFRVANQTEEFITQNNLTTSVHIIADHIRMLCFTLADGANFSNEGRGYVLRRVCRRAVRQVFQIAPDWDKSKSFLAGIVPAVVAELGDFYPELKENQSRIEAALKGEELRFAATLKKGMEHFSSFVKETKEKGSPQLSGEHMFVLHDRYGFPADLTQILCAEAGLKVDLAEFEVKMEEQREKSRNEAKFYKFEEDDSPWSAAASQKPSTFTGYGLNQSNGSAKGKPAYSLKQKPENFLKARQLKNKNFEFIFAETLFYPEGGGQVSDEGWIEIHHAKGSQWFEIIDVRKHLQNIIHVVKHDQWSDVDAPSVPQSDIQQWLSCSATQHLDIEKRLATARNHTATHLLHKALRSVLGENVRQAGSLVSPKGLRFDFSHAQSLSAHEIVKVERLVQEQILSNKALIVHSDVPFEQAKKMGAVAIFDEKYGDSVRVCEVPQFSLELCGGTHVERTGDIGLLKVTSESSVTTGVRRIEAISGYGALEKLQNTQTFIRDLTQEAKCAETELLNKIKSFYSQQKDSESRAAQLRSRLVNSEIRTLLSQSQMIEPDLSLIAAQVEAQDAQEMELIADRLREKGVGVVVLGAHIEDKVVMIAATSNDSRKKHQKLSAGTLIKEVSALIGGRGGGKPDFARGGGSDISHLPTALQKVPNIVSQLL